MAISKKKSAKEITITQLAGMVKGVEENLAAMTQRGFEEVHEKIDKEIGGLREDTREGFRLLRRDTEAGFESVDMRFDTLEEKMTLTNGMVSDHEVRIVKLERKTA